MTKERIYFDYQATTPLDKRVLDSMMPYLEGYFGNPMSKHFAGAKAKSAIDSARVTIAELVKCYPEEVIFTSGATESINLIIKGIAFGSKNIGRHIITSSIEHKSVLESCVNLQENGFEVSFLGVDSNGLISINELEDIIRPDTILISIGHANNEIGTIQNLNEISQLARDRNIHFFSDCAQSFGKINFDAGLLDSFSFSGHKIYGPMGTGGLIIKKPWHNKISKIIHGGGQEFDIRPGTHNVPGIIGLAEAARIAWEEMAEEQRKTRYLRDLLLKDLQGAFGELIVNGSLEHRLSNNINFSIPSVSNDHILRILAGRFAFSTGSACMSRHNQPSHVILALGKDLGIANSAIRVSFGRQTTEEEVRFFSKTFINSINKVKSLTDF